MSKTKLKGFVTTYLHFWSVCLFGDVCVSVHTEFLKRVVSCLKCWKTSNQEEAEDTLSNCQISRMKEKWLFVIFCGLHMEHQPKQNLKAFRFSNNILFGNFLLKVVIFYVFLSLSLRLFIPKGKILTMICFICL